MLYRNPHALLFDSKFRGATMKNIMNVHQKNLKNRTMLWTNNTTSGYISEEVQNTNSKRCMHSYGHCSIIYNTQVLINRWLNKGMVHICNGILFRGRQIPMISFTCGISKTKNKETLNKQNKTESELQIQKANRWLPEGVGVVRWVRKAKGNKR